MAELIGYVGSLLVAVSLMMSNIWKLRWINMVGAVFFVVYGAVVRAYPVVAVNAFIAVVDAYFLIAMARQRDFFKLLPIESTDEALLKHFLGFYKEDIARFFPGFDLGKLAEPKCVFILRNLMPVGLFVYEARPEGAADVHLDYAAPEYRDLKNARHFYGEVGSLTGRSCRTFRMRTETSEVASYLGAMGFEKDASESDLYVKEI